MLLKHRFLKIHQEEELGTFYELSLPELGLTILVDIPEGLRNVYVMGRFMGGRKILNKKVRFGAAHATPTYHRVWLICMII